MNFGIPGWEAQNLSVNIDGMEFLIRLCQEKKASWPLADAKQKTWPQSS